MPKARLMMRAPLSCAFWIARERSSLLELSCTTSSLQRTVVSGAPHAIPMMFRPSFGAAMRPAIRVP